MAKTKVVSTQPVGAKPIDETYIPARFRRNRHSHPGLSLDAAGGANPADAPGLEINSIMAQFQKHGTLPAISLPAPIYGDFTFPEDINSVREAVEQAEDRFMELPASVRTAAGNDWVKFFSMLRTDESLQVLTDAGLELFDSPPPPPESTNAPAVPPETPTTSGTTQPPDPNPPTST